jgi:uncharacterized membrane protein
MKKKIFSILLAFVVALINLISADADDYYGCFGGMMGGGYSYSWMIFMWIFWILTIIAIILFIIWLIKQLNQKGRK